MNVRPHIALLTVLVGLLLLPPAHAQPVPGLDPTKALTQYVHRSWASDDGLPQNSVLALEQTRDGYLWLGTQEGLVRFDGVRFTIFDKHTVGAFTGSHTVKALLEDRHGALWIGTRGGGLLHYAGGRFAAVGAEEGLAGADIEALFEDDRGVLWIGTWGEGLFRYADGHYTRYPDAAGGFETQVTELYQDRAGTLWVGTSEGLHVVHDGRLAPRSAEVLGAQTVLAIHEDRAGTLWVGTRQGLYRGTGAALRPHPLDSESAGIWALHEDRRGSLWIGTDAGVRRLLPMPAGEYGRKAPVERAEVLRNRVMTLLEDREGSLWIGTEVEGLHQIRNGKFITYSTQEQLAHDDVMSVYAGEDGAVWVGTLGGGLSRFQGGAFTTYTTADGLPSDAIASLSGTPDGAVWVGTLGGGLSRFQGGAFTTYTTADGLPSDQIYALAPGARGDLWVGTEGGIARFHGGRFDRITTEEGLPSNLVTALHEDAAGTLWVGTYDAGLVAYREGQVQQLTSADGLGSDLITALHEDAAGALWVGTYEGGLHRYKDGRLTGFTSRDGLFDDKVYSILEDQAGRLWMSSNRGLFHVAKQELERVAAGELSRFTSTSYGTADGLRSSEFNGGVQPAASKAPDGTFWFASVQGAVRVDPANLHPNPLPPPVVIETVWLDNHSAAPADSLSVPPGLKKVSFAYTAPSLIASDQIRFRYRLDGYDTEWQEAGAVRSATYTNLPPGRYVFRVMARNSDGVWSTEAATLPLYLQPFFYQTLWFAVCCALLLLSAVFGVYRIRVRHLRTRERELAQLVEVRTQDLSTAKDQIERQARALKALNESLERKVQKQVETILTERRHYEEQLVAAKDQAEASLRLKTAILNNMNHEFRTPLTAIQGYAQLLASEVPGELQEFAGHIDENGRRLMKTLDAVHQLSRLEAENLELALEPVDLKHAAYRARDRFSDLAARKGLTLRVHTAARGPVEALLDADALARALDHLLDNALKFTDTGEVVLEVDCQGADVLVRVRDTGIGIDPAFQPQLFEAFTQESSGLTRSHEGIGLGLAITKRLVDVVGGAISAESTQGEGSVFTLRFARHGHAATQLAWSVRTRGHA